jgi:hypothetical protein
VPDLESFLGIHRDETVVVCGCGASLNQFAHPERFVTIGVNDVGRRFDPTYLVVVNPRSQFSGDRFGYVERSRATYVFSQLDLGLPRDRAVRFRLGQYGGTSFADPRVLHYTRNSPYVAICLAVHMGARRIGVIGVDFTDHHFFGETGRHPLTAHVTGIDAEYRRLNDALSSLGVEIVNLSAASRLTAFPKAADTWPDIARPIECAVRVARPVECVVRVARPVECAVCVGAPVPAADPIRRRPRIFAVNYRFLACGDVFTDGLRHAADTLGIEWSDASWDDPNLPARVSTFAPDLLFVVHGRRFAQRWRRRFNGYRTAVWLLDEPYEVDDTAGFSSMFDHVFVNDPATLDRHRHAHYLPVCHDPAVHHGGDEPRPYDVGFIGGANPTRERVLAGLAGRGLLGYVVGGPWKDPCLRRLSLSANVSPSRAADLYRSTKIVVNVFRDRHHFNKSSVTATSMNPRIYEALACGALVISEARPEIGERIPELPVFHSDEELLSCVTRYLSSPADLEATRQACLRRVTTDTYAGRLRSVIATALGDVADAGPVASAQTSEVDVRSQKLETGADDEWEICGPVGCREHEGTFELECLRPMAAGSERGLVTRRAHRNVTLAFEAFLSGHACLVAKLNQADKVDQRTNSYHLYYDSGHAYLARHHCVFKTFNVPQETWIDLRLTYANGVLTCHASDALVHSVPDALLPSGYAVLAVKRGVVKLRRIRLLHDRQESLPVSRRIAGGEVLIAGDSGLRPRVSIVTTVYDRVDCLAHCIRSVRRQRFCDYEHIVVSDAPPPDVVSRVGTLVQSFNDGRISYINLLERHNNWGIAPAAEGLRRTRGQYVAFLSDDNGYTPDHLATLVGVLDQYPELGFVYSSCRYAGRLVLRHPVPAPARIDLGQPLFRRELFTRLLDDDLPFQMMAWDWALIDSFVQRGVRWRHVDVASFIFRLARYPQLMVRA